MNADQITQMAAVAADHATMTEQDIGAVVAGLLQRSGFRTSAETASQIVLLARPQIKCPENGYYLCDECEDCWVHIDEHCGEDGEYLCGDCYSDRHC
jgi:hypothetical protein